MERAKLERKLLRSKLTRVCNEIDSKLEDENKQPEDLQVRQTTLVSTMSELADVQNRLMGLLLDEDADEEILEQESIAAEDYVNRGLTRKIRLEKFLNGNRSPSPSVYTSVSNTSPTSKKQSYKLPKIELKKFGGVLSEWLGWWAQFEKIHLDEDIHNSDKFQYLCQSIIPNSRAERVVRGYPPTAENYPKVIAALKDRFGNPSILAEHYVRKLQNFVLEDKGKSRPADLSILYDELESNIRSLESLNVKLNQSAIFLLPLIESKLPMDLLRIWQRTPEAGYGDEESKPSEERLESLMSFLKREVKGAERIGYMCGHKEDRKSKSEFKGKQMDKNKNSDIPTAASLYTSSSQCVFCEKSNHLSQDCFKARTISYDAKKEKVKSSNCCFNCLRPGHSAKHCKIPVKCFKCNGKHQSIMCADNKEKPKEETQVEVTQTGLNKVNRNGTVLMKTLHVVAQGLNTKKKEVRLLFDEGSQRSYIRKSLAMDLNCKTIGSVILQNSLFGGVKSEARDKKIFEISLKSKSSPRERKYKLISEDVICTNVPTIPNGPWMSELKKRGIFVTDTWASTTEIDILIGSDLW